MRNMTKMMMLTGAKDNGGKMRYPYMGGNYGVEDRFRDRRGREHYDNDRYAPQNASRGTLTWDNTRGAESAYSENAGRTEMTEAESRQRRDSRGRFRSEMEGGSSGGRMEMHYPNPIYPAPVYEDYDRPNQIGFSAYDGEPKEGLHMIRGGGSYREMKLDENTAHEWMNNLKNEDGSTGPHWTMEQTTQVMKQKNVNCDPLEFWVAMNAVYSDYYNVAKKMNVNNVDFYVYMAKAFIDDKDAGEGKLMKYYQYIVK